MLAISNLSPWMAVLPNVVTVLRIFLTIVLIYIWFFSNFFKLESDRFLCVLILYIIAAATDYLDGLIARVTDQVSAIGKWLDPLADKIFIVSVFFGFLYYAAIPVWRLMISIITIREVAVTLLRVFSQSTGFQLASDQHGKVKTFFQMSVQIVLFAILLMIATIYESQSFQQFLSLTYPAFFTTSFEHLPPAIWEHYFSTDLGFPATWAAVYRHIPNILIFATMLITVYSGIIYFYKTFYLWQSKKNIK